MAGTKFTEELSPFQIEEVGQLVEQANAVAVLINGGCELDDTAKDAAAVIVMCLRQARAILEGRAEVAHD